MSSQAEIRRTLKPAAELAGDESGVTMLEYILFTSIVLLAVGGTVLYVQGQSEKRLDTGRSLYQCEQLCDPKDVNCQC